MSRIISLLLVICFGALANTAEVPLKEVPIALITERPEVDIDTPAYASLTETASRLAISEREKEFGRLGIKITIRPYFTDGGKVETYRTMQEILNGDAVAAVGLQSSDEAILAAPLLANTSFLVVSPYATSTDLLKFQPNLLQFAASNTETARATEFFLNQTLKPKRIVAIVAWDSAYAQNMYLSLSEALRSRTHLIKVQDQVGDTAALVKEVLDKQPDLVLLPDFPVTTATLIRALSHAGYRGNFLGTDSWGEGSDDRISLITKDTHYSGYAVRQFSRFKMSPGQERLKNKLAKLSSVPYPTVAGLYYDSVNYVLDLIRKAPKVSRKAVLELSQKHRTYRGISGMSCLSSPRCPDRSFAVVKLNDGKFSYFDTIHIPAPSEKGSNSRSAQLE